MRRGGVTAKEMTVRCLEGVGSRRKGEELDEDNSVLTSVYGIRGKKGRSGAHDQKGSKENCER